MRSIRGVRLMVSLWQFASRPLVKGGPNKYDEFGEMLSAWDSPSPTPQAGRGRGPRKIQGRQQTQMVPMPGDWQCTQCQEANYRKREFCHVCSMPVTELSPRWAHEDGTPWTEKGKREPVKPMPGDWLCPACNCPNFRKAEKCFSCEAPLPAECQRWSHEDGSAWGERKPKENDWTCKSCQWLNWAGRTLCIKCKEPPAPEQWKLFLKKGQFVCGKCNLFNFADRVKCPKCNEPRPEAAGPALKPCTPGCWKCAGCKDMNFASRLVCFTCGCDKTDACETVSPWASPQDGDWFCTTCEFDNARDATECRQCSTAIPEGTERWGSPQCETTSCEKCGLGNFKKRVSGCKACEAGVDWQCSGCKAMNFPFRKDCMMCAKVKEVQGTLGDVIWKCCVCRKVNVKDSVVCIKCKAPKVVVEAAATAVPPGKWRCKQCRFDNFAGRDKCLKCFTGMPLKSGHFVCASCSFLNFADRMTCKKCDMPRPASVPAAGLSPDRPGTWRCSGCQRMNFRTRYVCFSCKYVKDATCEVVPDPTGKPIPNVPGAAGDWICLKCNKANFKGNVKFCHRCKEPRENNFRLIM